MLEAIFWDNDGVLVDTEAMFFAANREIMGEHGVELDRATFVDWSLRRGVSIFDMLEGKSAAEREALRARRNEVYEAFLLGGVRVFDGVEGCLAELHGRVPMGVVTSAYAEHFDIIHAQTQLLRYFEFVLSGADYPRHKPHPDPYLAAAARLDVDPARCLVVEDSERGLTAARAAGMRCVVIPNELAHEADWSGAHAIVESVHEVAAIAEALL
ncbi:MAG: HAD family phosphatase [bacterium]|nr:HAD family phosphatase [bacterium]MCP5045370.1 HAD family phosphatase [bacterium]